MRVNSLLICCLLLFWGGDAGAQIFDIRVHDPVVIRQGDTYHLFCTGRGIGHYTSPDLENWTEAEPVFPEKPTWTDGVVPEFRNHIWAPDVLLHDGTYYLLLFGLRLRQEHLGHRRGHHPYPGRRLPGL